MLLGRVSKQRLSLFSFFLSLEAQLLRYALMCIYRYLILTVISLFRCVIPLSSDASTFSSDATSTFSFGAVPFSLRRFESYRDNWRKRESIDDAIVKYFLVHYRIFSNN